MTASVVDIFFARKADGWYFFDRDFEPVGPYGTRERAEEKRAEYLAYVVYAAGCHCHPPA